MAGKVWMITGASRGLGAEIAKAALAASERVIATGRERVSLNLSSERDALQIADYAKTVGKTRISAVERNHQRPGDPAKLAQALLQLANIAKPLLRSALRTDALERIAEKNAFVVREMAEWRSLTESTDFKEA